MVKSSALGIVQEKWASMEVERIMGRIPGLKRQCEDSESLSGKTILKQSSASQPGLDLVLITSMVLMGGLWGIGKKTWEGDVIL